MYVIFRQRRIRNVMEWAETRFCMLPIPLRWQLSITADGLMVNGVSALFNLPF